MGLRPFSPTSGGKPLKDGKWRPARETQRKRWKISLLDEKGCCEVFTIISIPCYLKGICLRPVFGSWRREEAHLH